MSELEFAERPAAGKPEGLLILHHGRGTDELDLLPLGDALDPGRRLHVVSVRAPLRLPGSPGYHWYVVPRVGYPDPATFHASFDQLAALHDELWQRSGIDSSRTVLGGFSMGAVMSYSLGLAAGRPAPAGIMAFSGFLPTVEGWEPDLEDRTEVSVSIAHGRYDPTISVELGRAARRTLEAAGLAVAYHEFDGPHAIDPAHIPADQAWLEETLS